jgi:ribonuclease P protein component
MRHGRSWRGKHIHARILAGAPRHPAVKTQRTALYVGAVVSSKTDKSAVRRNRMRRRCREALRVFIKNKRISSPAQLLLLPRSSSLDADFKELQDDVDSLLSFLFPHS